uniref:Uncharacterized protein n=1 Tax=Arundo donax TaxID=35708 RepID=A0A0A8XQ56_ARUDO
MNAVDHSTTPDATQLTMLLPLTSPTSIAAAMHLSPAPVDGLSLSLSLSLN